MNKKLRKELESCLDKMERGLEFLMQDETLICKKKNHKTTIFDFSNDSGQVCYSIDKGIGSPLQILETGINHLKRTLEGVKREIIIE